MKHCPTCQRGYEDSQRFCPQDATPLVEGGPAWAGAGGAQQPGGQPAAHGGSPDATRKRRLWPFVVAGAAVLAVGFLLLLALGAFFVTRSTGGRNANQTAAANVNAPGGYPAPPPGYNAAPPFGPNANAPAGGVNSNMGVPPGGPMGGPGGPGGMNPDPNMAPGGPGGMAGGAGMAGAPDMRGAPGGPGLPGGPGGGDGEVNVGGPEGDEYGDDGRGGSGGAGMGGGSANVPPELSRMQNEFVRANVTGDRAALENILADNFVGAMAGGPQVSKQQFLQNVRPDQSIASFNIENMRATERGNAAMLTGVIVLQTQQGPRRFRFADTYERQGGRWRLVNSQLAPG